MIAVSSQESNASAGSQQVKNTPQSSGHEAEARLEFFPTDQRSLCWNLRSARIPRSLSVKFQARILGCAWPPQLRWLFQIQLRANPIVASFDKLQAAMEVMQLRCF